MSELEILQKCDPLFHAYVSIYFKAYISSGKSWIYVPNDVLCNHIQGWCLLKRESSKVMKLCKEANGTAPYHAELYFNYATIFKLVIPLIIYLICCSSDDPNRKSEKQGKNTCQQDTPPWQLKLIVIVLACKYGCCNVYQKNAREPPFRYLLIFSHELCVYVHPLFFESSLA